MKASIFKILLCASLAVFAVGCGKDNKSSGGGTGPIPAVNTNPYTGTVPASSQQALNNFQAWYNSNNEGQFPGIGQKTEVRKITTYSQTDGCEQKPISVFGVNLGNLNYCFNSSSQSNSTEVSRVVNVLVNQTKSQNPNLAAAYSGAGMTLANVIQGQGQNGAYYQLEYAKSNGHRVVYTIDTGIHSAFNPVQITNSEARTFEEIIRIQ